MYKFIHTLQAFLCIRYKTYSHYSHNLFPFLYVQFKLKLIKICSPNHNRSVLISQQLTLPHLFPHFCQNLDWQNLFYKSIQQLSIYHTLDTTKLQLLCILLPKRGRVGGLGILSQQVSKHGSRCCVLAKVTMLIYTSK